MTPHEAIDQACAAVGIKPPRSYKHGQWVKCDTLAGKNGRGDGRIIVDDLKATAWNHQTGEYQTIWLKDRASLTPVEKKQFAERKAKDEAEQRERAARAAHVAGQLLATAKLGTHAYLARKGFPTEQAHVLPAADVAEIGGKYLVAEGAKTALIIPARIGQRVASAQIIWEDGTKKFLAGGEMGGATHRIATGGATWLCEGYATALSLRASLHAMNRRDTILVCFSASNIATVARKIEGRCFIAADHDPVPKADPFSGLGTGEHYAQAASRPYAMPPEMGDINDMHMSAGIFAVQKLLAETIRRAR